MLRALGNRSTQVNEDGNIGLNVYSPGPDDVLAASGCLNEQLIGAKRNSAELEFARGSSVFDVLRCGIAEVPPHRCNHEPQRLGMSELIEIREVFLVVGKLGLESFPVVVQALLHLSIP